MLIKTIQAMQQDAPEKGRLRIQVQEAGRALPVEDAVVDISYTGDPDSTIEEVTTDANGATETLELDAPPLAYSMNPSGNQPYSEYTFRISAPGYETITISGAEILPDETALQDVQLRPLEQNQPIDTIVIPAHTLYGDYPPKIAEAEIKPVSQTGEIVLSRVVVPEFVIVHNGVPTDPTATDYYIRYRDYIKNVASSEIYATWPRETIIANVLAIMSFTLNRVYTEWSIRIRSFTVSYLYKYHSSIFFVFRMISVTELANSNNR